VKRVHALALALPAAVGLTLPVATISDAGAASKPAPSANGAKSVSVVPLNSGKHCSSNGWVCISVIGTSLHVNTVHEWINHRAQNRFDRAQVYLIPQVGQYGLWLQRSATWAGTREFTWNPNCSWTSTGNIASAHAEWTAGQVAVSIWGNYQGHAYCHYL
jgi:hypothetical protein